MVHPERVKQVVLGRLGWGGDKVAPHVEFNSWWPLGRITKVLCYWLLGLFFSFLLPSLAWDFQVVSHPNTPTNPSQVLMQRRGSSWANLGCGHSCWRSPFIWVGGGQKRPPPRPRLHGVILDVPLPALKRSLVRVLGTRLPTPEGSHRTQERVARKAAKRHQLLLNCPEGDLWAMQKSWLLEEMQREGVCWARAGQLISMAWVRGSGSLVGTATGIASHWGRMLCSRKAYTM